MRLVQKRFLLTGIMLSIAMIFIDQNGAAVTLVNMQRSLHLSMNSVHWVINAYLLAFASCLLLAGRISDYIGYKKVYFMGHVLFLLASLLVACATNTWMMLLGRALQGVGASVLATGNLSLISHHFPENIRAKTIGFVVAVGAVFGASAPVFAGVFTEFLSWRWLFGINAPLVIIVLICIACYCPKDPTLPKQEKFDVMGPIYLIISIFSLVYALMQSAVWGFSNPVVLGMFALTIVSFILLLLRENRIKHPFVDFSIFKNKLFSITNIIISLANFTMIGLVYWTLWFRHSMGYSPLITGLALVPALAPTIILAPLAGKITDKIGAALPILIGSFCAFFGMAWFMFTSTSQDYWIVFPGILVYGFSLSLIFTPAASLIMGTVKPHLRGLASGVFYTTRQIGAAVGLALMGLVLIQYLNHNSKMLTFAQSYSNAFFHAMILPTALSGIGFILAIVLWWYSKKKSI